MKRSSKAMGRCESGVNRPERGQLRPCPSTEVAGNAVCASENRAKPTCPPFRDRMCRRLRPFRTATPQGCACLVRQTASRPQSASSRGNTRYWSQT